MRVTYDTLTEALSDLDNRGFTIDFNMRSDSVYCKALDRTFRPEEFTVAEYHRFEGASDPGDQSIVYAIETTDGHKGVLVDAYGIYSDPLSHDMIQKLKTNY
ncbi:phosphoribosylpyrophosphate synthetase [Aquimarina sediminis]|uniref:phosphoribosylpyrophosphate synthetase n=1 Tax=Aquimarina sediminis TaxID=2070536 RepID=UPI000CA01303|nr:phosphoribosylpyrophosphate synthetase [Aquimarina sediminis]